MPDKVVIQFNNASEKFRLYHQKNKDLKGRIFDLIKGKSSPKEEFWALKDVSFEIQQGEVVGIIGENGSGKTTILNLIAGILKPDEGEIKIQGRVSALLELGTGFHAELSGRENIYLYGAVLGLSKKVIDSKFDDIVRFAELEKFIDAPVKTYSAGMYVRLGFAIAINVDPDILLIDEVLAVGDEAYQRKCIKEIEKFKKRDKTIIFVSHSMFLISRICDRVIFLREGRVISNTLAEQGISLYMQTVGERKGITLIKKGHLGLIFNNGRIFLSWDDSLLTKDTGGYMVFKYLDNDYTSLEADWQINSSEEKDSLVFKGSYSAIPVTQTWYLRFSETGLIWQINLDNVKGNEISQLQLVFMLNDKYKQWIRNLEIGPFPDFNNKPWILNATTKEDCRFLGARCNDSDNRFLPAIIWEFSNETAKIFSSIQNTDSFLSARILHCQVIQPLIYKKLEDSVFTCKILIIEKEKELTDYLKVIIRSELIEKIEEIKQKIADFNIYIQQQRNFIHQRALEQKRLIEQRALEQKRLIEQRALEQKRLIDQRTLEQDKLRLFFDGNSAKLFWDKHEITKAGGMYTAFLYMDSWFNSQEADWRINKINDSKILVNLKWRHLPTQTQDWQISLAEDNSIKWDVYMKAEEGVKIEQSQMGILLSDGYREWIYSQKKGTFPEITPSDKYGQEVVLQDSACQFAAVEKVDSGNSLLPAVIFDTSEEKNSSVTLIENTSYQINARVLRSLTTEIDNKYLTAEIPLDSIRIAVDSKNGFIEDYLDKLNNKKTIKKGKLRLIF